MQINRGVQFTRFFFSSVAYLINKSNIELTTDGNVVLVLPKYLRPVIAMVLKNGLVRLQSFNIKSTAVVLVL